MSQKSIFLGGNAFHIAHIFASVGYHVPSTFFDDSAAKRVVNNFEDLYYVCMYVYIYIHCAQIYIWKERERRIRNAIDHLPATRTNFGRKVKATKNKKGLNPKSL